MYNFLKLCVFASLKRILKVLKKIDLIKKTVYVNLQERLVDLGEVEVKAKDLPEMKMVVNVMDVGVSHSLILRGRYEARETRLLKEIVKKGNNFVDIGANFGYYSLLAAKRGSKVYAFEPDPYNFKILKKNIELNGFKNIACFNEAAAEKEESLSFYIGYDLLGDQNLVKDASRKRIQVKGVPLDRYFGNKGKVNVVKIDVQGAEERVIRGMKKTIARSPKIKMLVEFSPEWIEKNNLKPINLLRLIKSLGFSIFFVGSKPESQSISSVLDEARKKRGLNLLLVKG